MWIECKCGAQIKDVTDAVQNKAYLTTDRDWFALSECEPEVALTAWEWRNRSRTVLECFDCGRLWIGDRSGQAFRSFAPEAEDGLGLLWETGR